MELKQATNLPTSADINVKKLSEKNGSNNRRVYDILYQETKDPADPKIDDNDFQKYFEKPIFGSVSTLDWLTTWRPLDK